MQTRGRAALRFLTLTVAGSIVVPLGLFIYVAAMERRSAFRQADERLQKVLTPEQWKQFSQERETMRGHGRHGKGEGK